MQEITPSELMAMMQYEDLVNGQVVIKVNGRYIVGGITNLKFNMGINELTMFNVEGYVLKK